LEVAVWKKQLIIIFFLVVTSLVVYGAWFVGEWELLLLALLTLTNKLRFAVWWNSFVWKGDSPLSTGNLDDFH